MARAGRYGRRALLAGALVALGSGGSRGFADRPVPELPLQWELERFLALLANEGLPPHKLRLALAAAERYLPASILAECARRATEAGVGEADFLAYNLVEALPVSVDLLSCYLPRVLAFALARQGRQHGLVGTALLPVLGGLGWEEGVGCSGLAGGARLGWHLGANAGLLVVCLAEAGAAWLGAGAPPTLMARLALQYARSRQGALDQLGRVAASRACRFLLYDCVYGRATMAEVGRSWRVWEPSAPVAVVAAPYALPAPSGVLRESLEANLGWLTAEKAVALLAESLPGSTLVVLDADERRGLLAGGAAVQEIGW